MDRPRKRRRETSCLSLVYYVIRNRHDPQLFYANNSKMKGWVRGIKKASVYKYVVVPNQIVRGFGKQHAEIVTIHGTLKSFNYLNCYMIKNMKTGEFVKTSMSYVLKSFFTSNPSYARLWLNERRVKMIMKRLIEIQPELADQLELIPMQLFTDKI